MPKIDLDVEGLEELKRLLTDAPEEAKETIKQTLIDYTYEIDDVISNRVRNGAGDSLHSRSGELRRSIRPAISGRASFDTLKAAVRTYSPYAPIHELGGTITAKRAFKNLEGGPYLAIPSDYNKTASGVPRNTPKMSFEQGAFIAPINGGKAKFAVFDKASGKPHHWLVKQVTIPARLKFRETFEGYIPEVERAVRWDLYQAMKDNLRN